ncbi:MAG: Mur ligase family protein, partial [Miltoncostaeaceae bacterium]
NGKTTTTRLLAGALRTGGTPVVTNAAGANLLSGVATTLAEAGGALGDATRGVFEVDEAAMPAVAARMGPRALLLMNLFRDQLDRHGELEAIAARWQGIHAIGAVRGRPAGGLTCPRTCRRDVVRHR